MGIVDRRAELPVVIAGAGAAGLWCAVRLLERGVAVHLLEAEPQPGGMSALSIGSITASETAWQRAAGVLDSHRQHLEDWTRMAERFNGHAPERIDLAQKMIETGPEVLSRLSSLGLEISGPHPEPPLHQVPRMHNVVGGGQALRRLTSGIERLGGTIEYGRRVLTGLFSDSGTLLGVVVGNPSEEAPTVLPARAVVLATGPVAAECRLEHRTSGTLPSHPLRRLAPFDRGDGHLIGLAAGGVLAIPPSATGLSIRTVTPPLLEPNPFLALRGSWLDANGNLLPVPAHLDHLKQMIASTERGAWLIWGAQLTQLLHSLADGPDSSGQRDGWIRSGKQPLCTAPSLGYAYLDDGPFLPGWGEAATVTEALHIAGIPDHQAAAIQERLGPGPYIIWGPHQAAIVMTKMGLVVDEEMRVQDASGLPVSGLWAIGNVAYIDPVPGHGYGLGWALTSAEVAAASVAGRV